MLVVVVRKPYFWGPILFCSGEILGAQRSVRVLDTKPRGLRVRALPASLPCVLEQDPLTNPCLVLGQPRKTRLDITEKIVYWEVKIQNQANCGLKGCAVSHWRKIQQCHHACPMETDVNKTADGFKNVFPIKETHRRMCIRLTAFQPFLLWNYNILI